MRRGVSVAASLRAFFAEEIRAAAALPEGPSTERVLAAFAAVPREAHVGPGPWHLRSARPGMPVRQTPDADPRHLYHNVLVALDEARGINIGEPALWAGFLIQASIPLGASILQIGAGSGYYTALLAELAGPEGTVLAVERDPDLAAMATRALTDRAGVTLRHGNGATLRSEDGPFDLIVAFAGVTHPAPAWLDRLTPGGQMLLPVTGSDGWGAMVLFQRRGAGFAARTLGRCGFFPCDGARDDDLARRLDRLWADPLRWSGATLNATIQNGRMDLTRPKSDS